MQEIKGWRILFARNYVKFQRGKGHLQFIYSSILLAVALKVYSLPLVLIVPFVVIGLFLCWLIGYLDEKYGFWKAEAVYGTRDLNPWLKKQLTKKQFNKCKHH